MQTITMKPRSTPLQRYALAVGVVALAFALRYGIYDTLDHRLPFSFFTTATLISAWYGGLGPGMLTAISGLLLGDYFFLPKHESGSTMGEAERTAIGLYAMNCALIVVLFWNLRSRLRDAEGKLGTAKPEKQD